MKSVYVLIIGAGPAGLFAGAQITDKSVVLLDQKEKTSLKLLMSGAGQCNFTHTGDVKHFLEQYNDHKAFLKVAFKQFFNKDAESYFNRKGLATWTREDGKIFPKSLLAEDIKKLLVNENKSLGHDIRGGITVKSIQSLEDGFQVVADKEVFRCRYLICAFGGCSYPTTGSDGKLFKVFKDLGHHLVPLRPSLAPIYAEGDKLMDLQGVSFKEIVITHYRNGGILGSYKGDLLITHFGLSGPVILNNSRLFMPDDVIRIQFGDMTKKALDTYLVECATNSGKQEVGTALKQLDYPKRLVEHLMSILKIPKNLKNADLSKELRKEIVDGFCGYKVSIHHVGGYNVAMATTGGIDLQDINRKTMASKLLPNLYFAGECVDIDGNTGGYNIQWAFTSGYIAGKSVDNLSQ